MKYLNLNRQEVRELKSVIVHEAFNKFVMMVLFTLLICYAITTFILHLKLIGMGAAVIFLVVFSYWMYHSAAQHVKDLLHKQKKIYIGILSNKYFRAKSQSYIFEMDGNKFVVSEEDFDKYTEGEVLEFHISYYGKHLFKIEKQQKVAA